MTLVSEFEQRGPVVNPNNVLISSDDAELFRALAFQGNKTRVLDDPQNPDQKIIHTSSYVSPILLGENDPLPTAAGFYAKSKFGETDDSWQTSIMFSRDKRRESSSDELKFMNIYKVVSEMGVITSAIRRIRMIRLVNDKPVSVPGTDPYAILKSERIAFEMPIKPEHLETLYITLQYISDRQKVIGGHSIKL